jgi:hypothetical protein
VAVYDVFIDCDSARIVTSALDNTVKAAPRFVQGDTMLLRVHLTRDYNRTTGFTEISTDGLTLQVALIEGVLSGPAAVSDIVAAQYTFTPYDGLFFEGELALNTAEIDAAIGSTNSFQSTLEIKYLRSGVPTTVLQQTVTIWRSGIDIDSVMPIAEPTPLSSEAAQATFVRIIETRPFYLQGANGTLIKCWNDDSSGSAVFKAESVE